MIYVYAAGITLAVTAVIVLFPIWRRGGRGSLVASRQRTVPLFAGLVGMMVLLAVALQQPAGEAVVAALSVGSAIFAAYWLTRTHDGRLASWIRAALVVALILALAIALVVVLGGLR